VHYIKAYSPSQEGENNNNSYHALEKKKKDEASDSFDSLAAFAAQPECFKTDTLLIRRDNKNKKKKDSDS